MWPFSDNSWLEVVDLKRNAREKAINSSALSLQGPKEGDAEILGSTGTYIRCFKALIELIDVSSGADSGIHQGRTMDIEKGSGSVYISCHSRSESDELSNRE